MKTILILIAIVFSGMLMQAQMKIVNFQKWDEAYYNDNNFKAKGIAKYEGAYTLELYSDRIVLKAMGSILNFKIDSRGYDQEDEYYRYFCTYNGEYYEFNWEDGSNEVEIYEVNADAEGWFQSIVLISDQPLYIGKI